MSKFIRNNKYGWIIGLLLTIAIVAIPMILVLPGKAEPKDDPWASVPTATIHTDHTYLLEGEFETGQDVTKACLECHEDASAEMMKTTHWTWESEPIELPGRDGLVTVGKANQINNFCIGVQGNWPKCTKCHTGYGWEDENFFEEATEVDVDCLACHAGSGTYAKGIAGNPAEAVDLLAAAQSVASPTRENCGSCHFNGGGGNAVKHGDLDESLYFPNENLDVHMGKNDFTCITCHEAENHEIEGKSISVSFVDDNQVYCTDCHSEQLHEDERLNEHVETVACQTCHIPAFAIEDATKMVWDWSKAGDDDREEDTHEYLKIKGEFVYEENVRPEYLWYNGIADRYLLGDIIDPNEITAFNMPQGDISDPNAKIFPFKEHLATQIYDANFNYFIQPKTVGEGGYWEDFDWQMAAELGAEITGLPYSGEYGWAQSTMYWPTTHMVQPASEALQCTSCHGDNGILDWEALGYPGDPMDWGSRFE